MAFFRSRALAILLAGSGFLVLGAAAGGVAFYLTFLRDLPDLRSVDDYRPPLSSRVYDRHGTLIGEFFNERRRLTPLDAVPEHVIDAFVAGEDSSFFEHAGVDYRAILRAAWANLRAGGTVEGASTITQQTVKGLLLTPERTYRRKIREMILARELEQRFSKREILYLYLNQIYFGGGAYGIGEAARTYFDKSVGELTVSEGALLAGLPKAPSRYSPYVNPDQADTRRRYVLRRMREDAKIDDASYEAALAEPLTLADRSPDPNFEAAAYFTEEVRRQLFDRLGGDAVLRGGLEIETTLDVGLQRAAVDALQQGLEDLDKRQGYRGVPRHVAPGEIEAELVRLAEANGFAAAEPAEDAETATEAPDAETPALPEVADDQTLSGVVVEVDKDAQRARVAFGAGVEGVVVLDDVSWAREPDPSRAPRKVRSIDAVFAEGDVARFRVRPPTEKELAARGEDEPERLHVVLHQDPIVQGALFSFDVESGDVLALVGGYDFEQSQFNRVTQAKRQPGSSFKPLIYAAALSHDYTPASILHDRPVVYTDEKSGFTWRPRNYGRSFYGPITLRAALVRSVNNATVHLFRDVGVDYVIDYSRRLGIESPLNRDLSLALGSSPFSLLELTRAYGVFPAGGRLVVPTYIRRVTDREGQVLMQNEPLGTLPAEEEEGEPTPEASELLDVAEEFDAQTEGDQRVISPEEAYLVTDLLRAVVVDPKGTGWRLRALRRPVAGKTGTTNDQADAWFMGFSPDIVTGVWVGHDESRFLGWGETGSRAAAPVWVDYMRAALAQRPVTDFKAPESIVTVRIDRETGLLADSTSTDTVFQPFLAGTEPTEEARTARRSEEGRRILRMDF